MKTPKTKIAKCPANFHPAPGVYIHCDREAHHGGFHETALEDDIIRWRLLTLREHRMEREAS